MPNRGRSKSVHPARGGSCAGSVPPEEHLGLGTMLPARRPPSSIKDNTSGSSGKKMKAGEPGVSNICVFAGQNEVDVNGNLSTAEILALDDDDPEAEEVAGLTGKRKKRYTSAVWQYFTKRVVEVEVDGKKYEQLRGYCNFPKCKQRYRAESTNGTNAFRSHLRTSHSIVKGQMQLKVEKDRGKDITNVQCLEKFYHLTELLSGTSYPTANLFYRGFCEIRELLSKWKNHSNLTIREMSTAMSIKFEKYWECSSRSLAVACFFDPRYKKKIIEFFMRKFDGDYYQVQLEEFMAVVKKLYQFYSASKPTSPSSATVVDASTPAETNEYSELESFLYDDSTPGGKETNELDMYIAEPLLKQDSFDILAYWKNKTDKYPVLSQIARDLMSIQVSTVASESAFSAAGRVVDPYRNRLDPEMVQALVCCKDWIHATAKDRKSIPSIVADLKPEDNMLAAPNDEEDDSASDPDEMDDTAEL